MNRVSRLVHAGVLAFAALFFGVAPMAAGEGRVPLPVVSKGEGAQCVAPVALMRRNHMDYLTHQRDETVREGVRSGKYSLKECVACHATADPRVAGGEVRTVQPFCRACHVYPAVKIDCFTCQSDRPARQARTSGPPAGRSTLLGALWSGPRQRGPPP